MNGPVLGGVLYARGRREGGRAMRAELSPVKSARPGFGRQFLDEVSRKVISCVESADSFYGRVRSAAIGFATLTGQTGRRGRAGGHDAKPYTTWRSYAGGQHSSQYSALDQINKGNVGQARSGLELSDHRQQHLQSDRRRRRDVRDHRWGQPGGDRRRDRARRSGRGTSARWVRVASTTGRVPIGWTAGWCSSAAAP